MLVYGVELRDKQQQQAITQDANITKKNLGKDVFQESPRMTRPDSAVAIENLIIPRSRSALGSIHVQREKRFKERCSEGANVAEHPPPSRRGRSDRLDWVFLVWPRLFFPNSHSCQSQIAISTPKTSTLNCSSC
jgi:hypothetical protein